MEHDETPSDINQLNLELEESSNELEPAKEDTVPSTDVMTDTIDGPPCLSDGWQIDQTLGQSMLNMFDAQLWTDVAFRCVDQAKEDLRAHRIVLAARSPVFRAMFFGPCQDNNVEIEIHDTESDVFKMFLRFVYSDDFDLFDGFDDLVNMLDLAHKYQIQVLVDGVSRRLTRQVSVENACILLDRALLYEDRNLKEKVADFIDSNAEKVLMSEDFLNISLRCLIYILKAETFYASETHIFNRTMDWAKRRCDSTDGMALREALGDAFYFLRTPTMSVAEFTSCTKRKGYYSLIEHEDLIDVIGSTGNTTCELECNSSRKRIPKLFEFEVSDPDDDDAVLVYYNFASETADISPKVPVYLTEFKLHNRSNSRATQFYDDIARNHFSNRQWNMRTEAPHRESLIISIEKLTLSVDVTLDGLKLPVRENTFATGDQLLKIDLLQPMLLSPGMSYRLHVKIALNGIDHLKLGYREQKPNERIPYSSQCRDLIGVKTPSTHRHSGVQIINSLTFTYKSSRD